MIERILLPFPV